MLRIWIVPYFLVFPVAFTLNRLGQHYNIDPTHPLKWSTVMKPSRLWDFLFVYSNYHAEHHYFPSVPFYNLRKLHMRLRPLYDQLGLEAPHLPRDRLAVVRAEPRAPHRLGQGGPPGRSRRGPHHGVAARAGSGPALSAVPRLRATQPRRTFSGGRPDRYGLMSRIGVPSSMSRPRTRRSGPSRPSSSTTERPIAFGAAASATRRPVGRLLVERDGRDELVPGGAVEDPQDEEVGEPLDVLRARPRARAAPRASPRRGAPPRGPWGSPRCRGTGCARSRSVSSRTSASSWLTRCLPGATRLTSRGAAQDRRRHAAPRPDRRRRLRGERRPDLPRRERPLGEPPHREGGDARGLPGGPAAGLALLLRERGARRATCARTRATPPSPPPRRGWATASSS